MKKLFALCLLLVSLAATAQTEIYWGSPNTLYKMQMGIRPEKLFGLPIRDTTFAPRYEGLMVVRPQDTASGTIYISISTVGAHKWQALLGSGGFALPSQSGNAGKVLGTNGTTPSWVVQTGGGIAHIAASSDGHSIESHDGSGTLVDNVTLSIFNGNKEVHTTGSTRTLGDLTTLVFIDPPSTAASITFTTPANPTDGEVIRFKVGGTVTSGAVVTSFAMTANSGQSLANPPPATLVYGDTFSFTYTVHNHSWYR